MNGKGTNVQFGYDDYGNLVSDPYKEITDISYNHLNLPVKITFGGGGKIEYFYDATGLKLKKKVTDGTTITTTDYMDGFQYTNGKLDFFPHAEGYAKAILSGLGGGTSYTFKYVFSYTDHLGNIRVKYAQNPANGNQIEILEEDHYYPYGLKHNGYNGNHTTWDVTPGGQITLTPVNPFLGDTYKYGFNGKEYQPELGLNGYDFGARNYDPALGRWMNMDPLAEKYYSNSSYLYAGNVPTRFVDYDGRDFGISFENGVITITQNWYNDGGEKSKNFLNEAIDYLMGISGDYALQTEDGETIPIAFAISVSDEKGETVDDGFLMTDTNQIRARRDDLSNYLSEGGMELRNAYRANGLAREGGDDTKFCGDCTLYNEPPNKYDADGGVVTHEIFHTLGISHSAIGQNGQEMNIDGIGGMLQYASKNARGVKIKLNNIGKNSYLGSSGERVNRRDKPKVVKTSNEKIKLNGTIVKIN